MQDLKVNVQNSKRLLSESKLEITHFKSKFKIINLLCKEFKQFCFKDYKLQPYLPKVLSVYLAPLVSRSD